jgi:hypothetical protein
MKNENKLIVKKIAKFQINSTLLGKQILSLKIK